MARVFNGSSDFIGLSMPAGDTSLNINVGAWIQTTATNGTIISSDTGSSPNRIIQFKMSSGVILFITFTTSTAHQLSGSLVVNDGFWHHVVGSYDGTTMQIYVDGVADGTLVTGTNRSFASHSARIGAHLAGITQSVFSGNISEAFIRYSGITAAEAAALAGGARADRLVADHYWPLLGVASPEPDVGAGTETDGSLSGTTSVVGPPEVNRSLFIPSLGRRPVPMIQGPDKDHILGMRGNSY